ncbi:MAG: SAF domain-containing protein [Clostridia bacterium]
MLGMNQIKKKLYSGIAIGLGIGILCAGLVVTWSILTIKSYENGTNTKYNKNFTKTVVVLNDDLVQGQVITSNMLKEIRVNSSTIPKGSITSTGSAVGQTAKYNIAANSPIVSDMLTDKVLYTDIREQELNTVLLPSDLAEGDFIDVRIMFPNGTDYIVLSEKQVNKISSQTIWLNLNENERLILNGGIVDSFLNKGTKLYATRYSDPDAQIKFAEDNKKVVKDYLTKMINEELPELANIGGNDKN